MTGVCRGAGNEQQDKDTGTQGLRLVHAAVPGGHEPGNLPHRSTPHAKAPSRQQQRHANSEIRFDRRLRCPVCRPHAASEGAFRALSHCAKPATAIREASARRLGHTGWHGRRSILCTSGRARHTLCFISPAPYLYIRGQRVGAFFHMPVCSKLTASLSILDNPSGSRLHSIHPPPLTFVFFKADSPNADPRNPVQCRDCRHDSDVRGLRTTARQDLTNAGLASRTDSGWANGPRNQDSVYRRRCQGPLQGASTNFISRPVLIVVFMCRVPRN